MSARYGQQVKILRLVEDVVEVNAADDEEAIQDAIRDYGAVRCIAIRPTPMIDEEEHGWRELRT